MKVQKLNKRQARWTLYLSKFDFSLKHIPEIKMEKIDSLSRKLDWKIEVERDNKDQVFIKDHWIRNLSEVVIEGPEVDIVEKIKRVRSKNKEVIRVVKEIKRAGVKVLQEDKWQIEEDLVLKEEKIYVLRNEELRVEIVWLHHNVLVAKYKGRWKTMELVTRNY